jgi:hypothetical protein
MILSDQLLLALSVLIVQREKSISALVLCRSPILNRAKETMAQMSPEFGPIAMQHPLPGARRS